MKKLALLLLLSSFSVMASEVKVEVPGMVCQMCVQGMKNSFEEVVKDPEKDVLVDLDKKTVIVKLKKTISDQEIEERVKDAGYNAKKITWLKK
jgi:copper chaperone CopZ